MYPYAPTSFDDYYRYYTHQTGAGYAHPGIATFRAPVYQRGNGLGALFSGLFRALTPLFRSGAKHVGRELAATAVNVGSDVLRGENLGRSLTTRTKESGANLLDDAVAAIRGTKQAGGRRKRKKKKSNILGVLIKKSKLARRRKSTRTTRKRAVSRRRRTSTKRRRQITKRKRSASTTRRTSNKRRRRTVNFDIFG